MSFFFNAIQRRWLAGRTENVAFANKLIEKQTAEEKVEIPASEISHSLDEKTVQKAREILADISRYWQ